MKKISAAFLILTVLLPVARASEVLEETSARVVVREHPRTGRPYVSVTSPGAKDPFEKQRKNIKRPDYRMLDPKVKTKDIPYDGPVSDRKKVYLLAGTLAATGAVAGTAAILAAPAATGAGAAGGAGAYGAAGVGVIGATAGTLHVKTRPDPEHDDVSYTSASKLEKAAPVEDKKTA